jgi:hypothetical protein
MSNVTGQDPGTDLIEPLDEAERFPRGRPAGWVENDDRASLVVANPGDGGQLAIPFPSDPAVQARMAQGQVFERLRGRTTARDWLPDDNGPEWLNAELANLRDEQLRVRDQIAVDLNDLKVVTSKFRREDGAHEQATRDSIRSGAAVNDQRTPADQRAAERKAIEDHLYPACEVLADIGDQIVMALRKNEPELLAAQRVRLVEAADRRRELNDLLAQAQAVEFAAHKRALWIKAEAEDGPLARQPVPTGSEPAPDGFDAEAALHHSTQRDYREWDRLHTRVPASIR